MKKHVVATLMALLILCASSVSALAGETVKGAKLYVINNADVLEYNVVYSADISGAKVVDKTGQGISTVAKLKDLMGVADAPQAVLSTNVGERTLGKAVIADLEFNDDGKIANVVITSVRNRPVVGISWKKDTISDYKSFAEAFERNGAFVVYLPKVKNAEEAKAVLSKVNGIFETGGEDWNPKLYNEKQTPHGSSGWNDARDTSDINLMQQAVAMDVPMLAVCRGEQGFNVAMGGGLIQDIPYYLGQKVKSGEIAESRVTGVISPDTGYKKWDEETQSYDKVICAADEHYRVQVDGLIHSGGTKYHNLNSGENIGILADSKWLHGIIGATSIDFVATAHHQAVNPDKLGKGLSIAAYASDGIIEAIEHRSSLFALAIQWHPERDALKDTRGVDVDQDKCNALLGALVKYAGVHAGKSSSSSSGCNTGVAGFASLLAVSVLFGLKKRK